MIQKTVFIIDCPRSVTKCGRGVSQVIDRFQRIFVSPKRHVKI